MEPILQAVQRAKVNRPVVAPSPVSPLPLGGAQSNQPVSNSPAALQGGASVEAGKQVWLQETELSWDHLETQRIVSHNVTDIRAKAYDVLRTQVVQAMDKKDWHLLAVTSPTEGCGKSITTINLALSLARQPERPVVLIDLDLQRPRIGQYLGIKPDKGVVGVLSGKIKLQDAMVNAQIGGYFCSVLPAENRSLHSSELIASRAMRSMLQDLRTALPNAIVILDLPPVLSGDDVLSVIPHVDCFLMVAAVGRTTVSDVRECSKHLHGAELLRIVLNKSSEQQSYYGLRAEHM
jgi:Mrp family chromosome partitioning ATPase